MNSAGGDPIGGRVRSPDGVLAGDADCEAELDYILSLYLGRDDFSSILIEDVLLSRLGHDKKLDVLRKILRRHEITFDPYSRLAGELSALRRFRNELAHTVAHANDPWRRIRRRAGTNELVTVTEEEVVEQLQRAMGCQSALHLLRVLLADRPAVDPPSSATAPLFAWPPLVDSPQQDT